MGHWIRWPWPLLAGFGLLWLALILGGFAAGAKWARFEKMALRLLFTATLVIVGAVGIEQQPIYYWDFYNAAVAWMVALAILLTGNRHASIALKRRWLAWFEGWAFGGAFIWLVSSYLENQSFAFYAAVLAWLALLIACKRMFQLPAIGIQIVNTLIVLFIVFPIADLCLDASEHFDIPPRPEEKAYSFESAQKNPAAYSRWWKAWQEQWETVMTRVFLRSHGAPVLRPASEAVLLGSRIRINNKGFRGEEIPDQKGDAYRIVALGESTTFGLTISPRHTPWPQSLEQMIRERLGTNRPVQVINAGVPGITLEQNLERLPRQVLPLQPDMLISYHGWNGFGFIYDGLPPLYGKLPPRYCHRPLKLLADFEYAMKMRKYFRQSAVRSVPRPAFLSSPMETRYARHYEQLIEMTRTNGIRLVIATYSMAVNDQSSPDCVAFYRRRTPSANWDIKANQAHTAILRQLAREHPDITLVDTQFALDGHHENFFDLMHFTPDGEQRMAEIFFEGIKPILAADLAPGIGSAGVERNKTSNRVAP